VREKERERERMDNQLPFHSGPVDILRYGFSSLETEHALAHPVLKIEKNVSLLLSLFFSSHPPFSPFFLSLLLSHDNILRESQTNGMRS
jgi:hypothetical protein